MGTVEGGSGLPPVGCLTCRAPCSRAPAQVANYEAALQRVAAGDKDEAVQLLSQVLEEPLWQEQQGAWATLVWLGALLLVPGAPGSRRGPGLPARAATTGQAAACARQTRYHPAPL